MSLLVVSAGLAHATEVTFGDAAGYNVFVFNNFTEYNTSVGGKVAVGGNFAPSGGSGITIASALSDGAGVYDLVVGGNFTETGYSVGAGGTIYLRRNLLRSELHLASIPERRFHADPD